MSPTRSLTVPSPEFLYFRRATTGEKLICWNRNRASWGGLLNLPDYLGRETLNGSQLLTRDGKIKYWVLSSREQPPPDGEERPDTIYAACETLQKPVIVKTRDNKFSEEISYGIASVFTNPKCRGKGVASVLLERLGKWLDMEGNCRFSTLYSDIGKEFYVKRGGWRPFCSRQITLSVSSADTKRQERPETKPLQRADLEHLCTVDQDALRSQFRALDIPADTYARVTFLPTFAQACWHFGTEEYVGEKVFGKAPTTKGALADDNTWLYWVHDFTEEKLVILRVVTIHNKDEREKTVRNLLSLLRAAENEAKEWAFGKVVAWNPSEELVEAAKVLEYEGGEIDVSDRENDSIPSLRWRGEDVKGITEWDPNEKYAWC